MLSYAASLVATCAGLAGLYVGVLILLDRAGNLPPPPIVNSLCADRKLQLLREKLPDHPTHLIVGSSVAWRGIDSAQLARSRGTVPLNEGFCAAQMHQVAFVTDYMLRRFPSIRTVVAVVEPHDFRNCDNATRQLFPPEEADDYIFRRRWLYGFYLRYFDLHSLQRNVRDFRAGGTMNPAVTEWGDAPLYGQHELYYGKFEGYDQSCFTALHELAASLSTASRRFVVATMPTNPAWRERYDLSGTVQQTLSDGLRVALSGTGAVFWDGGRSFAAESSLFTDAVHLQWPAAQHYTAALLQGTGLGSKGVAARR